MAITKMGTVSSTPHHVVCNVFKLHTASAEMVPTESQSAVCWFEHSSSKVITQMFILLTVVA